MGKKIVILRGQLSPILENYFLSESKEKIMYNTGASKIISGNLKIRSAKQVDSKASQYISRRVKAIFK